MHPERRDWAWTSFGHREKNVGQKSHFTKTLQLADQEDPSIGFLLAAAVHTFQPQVLTWHFTLRQLGQLGCKKSQGKDRRSMLHVCLHALLEEPIGTMILPDGTAQGHLLAEMKERGLADAAASCFHFFIP